MQTFQQCHRGAEARFSVLIRTSENETFPYASQSKCSTVALGNAPGEQITSTGMICEIMGGLMLAQELIFGSLFPEDDKIDSGEFTIAGRRWRTSRVFETYWRFAVERQKIFFARLNGNGSRTDDPIFQTFKFTNAYRASDRVSQYLIRNVAYEGAQTPEALFYRIMLFKLFNKIETWELLQSALGELTSEEPRFDQIRALLNQALGRGVRIYSAAYIMPSGGGRYPRKHDAHLSLLEKMMIEGVPGRLEQTPTMSEAFQLLKSFPMLGDFLAYQFVTDLNYSTVCNFSEMEFVVAGPGARNGIRKCFPDLPMELANETIKAVCVAQEEEFDRRGLTFPTLWGRPL